jgi:hypothetical protein
MRARRVMQAKLPRTQVNMYHRICCHRNCVRIESSIGAIQQVPRAWSTNRDLMLPTDDLSSYIEVPEKRGLSNFTCLPAHHQCGLCGLETQRGKAGQTGLPFCPVADAQFQN